jgi:hypothetical protein
MQTIELGNQPIKIIAATPIASGNFINKSGLTYEAAPGNMTHQINAHRILSPQHKSMLVNSFPPFHNRYIGRPKFIIIR